MDTEQTKREKSFLEKLMLPDNLALYNPAFEKSYSRKPIRKEVPNPNSRKCITRKP